MKKYNFYNNLNNLFFKNTVFNKKIKNNRSSFSNVKYVFSIGDIHGDYQTFKNTILEIGKNKFISNGQNNIFNIYTKNIFGVEFELCTINEYNITNDNFIILQLGDLFYSAYKYDLTNNEEIKLIFFIFSLFDEFNRINKINKNCKYIQLLGNHDILLLASSKENIVFRHIDYIFNHNDMIENREIDNIDDFISDYNQQPNDKELNTMIEYYLLCQIYETDSNFEGYDTSYHYNLYEAANEEIYNHLAVMEDTPKEVVNELAF